MSGLEGILPFILIAVVFWFLLIRPQRKRQMELLRTQRSVDVGDEVLLGAGIVGRVVATGEEYLHLEVSPGVQLQVVRGAIVRILTPEQPGPVADEPGDTAPDAPARDS